VYGPAPRPAPGGSCATRARDAVENPIARQSRGGFVNARTIPDWFLDHD